MIKNQCMSLRPIAAIAMVSLLAGCVGGGPAAPTSRDASARPVQHSPSPSPSPAAASSSPTATATPAESPTLGPDRLAQVVTTDLVVRSAPGVAADSEIYPELLNEPTLLFVVDGPVAADGFDWYLVEPFSRNVCLDVDLCPARLPFGWVAQAGSDGEVWVAPASVSCPDTTVDEIQWVPLPGRLACFGGETLQFEGEFGPCFNEKMGGIVYAAGCMLSAPAWEPGTGIRPPGITLRFDQVTVLTKDGSLTHLPASAPLVRVTGQFDHAKAADCGRDQYPLWQLGPEEDPLQPIELETALQRVLHCRSEFVVSEVRLLE